ncbi:hypothetical protein NM688_g2506 [Phlebia brevispora]|uniref:Uncharacterized protein n=1 Tax=Phlebia brevispora TaxID=194682 RepID=A0ACC1T861_9APHY|nr:hypothetical protein NM688_g2506 [Phlebia brevispora]
MRHRRGQLARYGVPIPTPGSANISDAMVFPVLKVALAIRTDRIRIMEVKLKIAIMVTTYDPQLKRPYLASTITAQ